MIGSIFLEQWWLNAVAEENAHTATYKKNGDCFARLNFVRTRKRGLTRLYTPQLTQFSGLFLKPKEAKYAKVLSYQKECIEGVLNDLPPFDIASFNLDPTLLNGLPFFWEGFNLNVAYTYILKAYITEEEVWSGCMENIRTDVRKARKSVEISFNSPLSVLLELVDKTFERQGKTKNYSNETILKLDQVIAEKANRLVLVANDGNGNLHAGAYFVWDNNAMHYLIGGGDPLLRNSGATSLILWEAIKLSRELGLDFNFEGSMIKGVEKFYRGFGALQVPYLQVSKYNRKAKLYRDIYGILKLGKR